MLDISLLFRYRIYKLLKYSREGILTSLLCPNISVLSCSLCISICGKFSIWLKLRSSSIKRGMFNPYIFVNKLLEQSKYERFRRPYILGSSVSWLFLRLSLVSIFIFEIYWGIYFILLTLRFRLFKLYNASISGGTFFIELFWIYNIYSFDKEPMKAGISSIALFLKFSSLSWVKSLMNPGTL